MSASSIQKKIDLAHKKVASKLGYEYNLYRPINNTEFIHDSNIMDTVKLTTTLNDSYTSTVGFGVPVWTAYTEAAKIQEGDFLYSEQQDRTFFILSRLPHLPVLAMEVPTLIDIQAVTYNDTDGFAPAASSYIARKVPAYVSMGAAGFGGGVPGRNVASTGMRTMKVVTTFINPANLIGATISTGDFRGDVVSYKTSTVGCGIELTVQEFERT